MASIADGSFSFSLRIYEGSNISSFFQNFLLCTILKSYNSRPKDVKWRSTVALICISLIIRFKIQCSERAFGGQETVRQSVGTDKSQALGLTTQPR